MANPLSATQYMDASKELSERIKSLLTLGTAELLQLKKDRLHWEHSVHATKFGW